MLLAGRGWTERGRERRMEGGQAVEMEGIWRENEEEVERARKAGCGVIRGRERRPWVKVWQW